MCKGEFEAKPWAKSSVLVKSMTPMEPSEEAKGEKEEEEASWGSYFLPNVRKCEINGYPKNL